MELKVQKNKVMYNLGDGWKSAGYPGRFLIGAVKSTYERFCTHVSTTTRKKVSFIDEIRVQKTPRGCKNKR